MAFQEETANTPAGGGIRWFLPEGAELAIASTVDVSGYNGAVTFTGAGTVSQLDGLASGEVLLFRVAAGATLAFGSTGNIVATSGSTYPANRWYMLWNNGGTLYVMGAGVASSDYDSLYVNVTGDTMTGAMKIQASSAGVNELLRLRNSDDTLAGGAALAFTSFTGGDVTTGRITNVVEGGGYGISFSSYYGGLFERLRISKEGYVGIGTTTPLDKLGINGNIGLHPSGKLGSGLGYTGGAGQIAAGTLELYNTSSGAATLASGGSFPLLLNPTSAGNVGIGTAAPGTKLEVQSSAPVLTLADSRSVAANNGGSIVFNAYGVGTSTMGNTALIGGLRENASSGDYKGQLSFYTNSGSVAGSLVERMTISSAGYVGVGSTAPKSPLHVVGLPVYANNAAAVAGGLTAGAFYRTGADPDPVCVVH